MHDSNGTFKGCVFLLDEPGLHLHLGGQQDLLKRLDEYSHENVTLYTTHLPFLVDLRKPARIKVITQREGVARVSKDLGSHSQERLTFQAALGMQAGQNWLVAERNLVVEGVDDYWIISELSNALVRSGVPCLPEDVMVTAAGNASEVVHLSTFTIGQGLRVVALFDSDEAGRCEEQLRTKWLARYKSSSESLLLGQALEKDSLVDFEIEDVFPPLFYIECAREAHGEKLRRIGLTSEDLALQSTGHNLADVQAAATRINLDFCKGAVAKVIRKRLVAGTADTLPEETRRDAEMLFARLGRIMDKGLE